MMETQATIKKIIEQNKGFTLIEIMIAIFILTVGILALVSVTITVIKGNTLSKNMTTATTLARDQLETLKNNNFGSIASSSWSAVTGFSGYDRQWTVTPSATLDNISCTGTGAPYACCTGSRAGTCPVSQNIVMEVRWQWQGNYHYATLSTIISQQ